MKPDKGNGVVILDRSDYDLGIQNIIQDRSKFKPQSQDPTLQREGKLQRLLRKLNKKGHFEDDDYSRIYPKSSNPARIYGLPKMHKPRQQGAVPLFRPIVSSIGAYNYNLAKYLCNLLTPLIPAEFCPEDSFSFVNVIQKLSMHNKFMASFDVESLFRTNIPLEESIDLAVSYITQYTNTTFSAKELKDLFHIATAQSHLSFTVLFMIKLMG